MRVDVAQLVVQVEQAPDAVLHRGHGPVPGQHEPIELQVRRGAGPVPQPGSVQTRHDEQNREQDPPQQAQRGLRARVRVQEDYGDQNLTGEHRAAAAGSEHPVPERPSSARPAGLMAARHAPVPHLCDVCAALRGGGNETMFR